MDRLKKLQERAEKKKKQQRKYYHQNSDHLRARAKLYRDRWTDEQRRKKRERDLAYYHRTKKLIANRRRVARQERSDDQRENEKQQRRVRNKTEYAREKHRRDLFYYKHREVILQRQSLPKPLDSHSRQAEGVQTETGRQEMGPPASVGGGVSASERWDVQWQLQRRLDECRRRCQFDIPFHFTVYAVIGKADVVVPPEPFPFSRQALDTAIELL